MQVEVSNGEIVDKLTILEIKLSKITDIQKRINLVNEYTLLNEAVSHIIEKEHELYKQLYAVNLHLWEIEDKCRAHEAQQLFDASFIEIARSVYITNDKRAILKKQINELTGSHLIEEKSYQ